MAEGAKRIPCSLRNLYKLAADNEIPTYMVVGRRYVDDVDIDDYIQRCRDAGPRFQKTGFAKRPVGRPRKHPKPEATAASAEG